MEIIKSISVRRCLLFFLVIPVLSFGSAFTVVAQPQSGPSKIEGEQFEGMVIVMPRNSLLHTYYNFGKQGRVICQHLVVTPAQTTQKQEYNTVTEKWEWVTGFIPGSVLPFSADEIGTYTQTDENVRLTFSDRYVEAKLKVEGSLSGLDGTTTFKGSNKKERFLIVRKNLGSRVTPDRFTNTGGRPDEPQGLNNPNSAGINLADLLSNEPDPIKPADTQPKRTTPGSGFDLVGLLGQRIVLNDDGSHSPENGYRWINSKDPNDLRVELMPGLVRTEKGDLSPAKGFRWVRPNDPKDLRVERIP
jgi:hypothetical protein